MRVRRQLRNRQRVRLLATPLAQGMTTADMNGRAPAVVGQRKVDTPVAAERRAKQREQRLVLIDRQELPVAQRPALGGEDEGHDPDFRQKWLSHVPSRTFVPQLPYVEFRAESKAFLSPRALYMPQPIVDRRTALVDALLQEMVERIDMSGRDIRVRREISERIEARRRVAPFAPTVHFVMRQRIDARGCDVGIVLEISGRVEERIRVAVLMPAVHFKVRERIDARGGDIRIL